MYMYHDIQRNAFPSIDIMNVFVSMTIKQSKFQTSHNALRLTFFKTLQKCLVFNEYIVCIMIYRGMLVLALIL